jgi:tetratricopeptide (TPR) repeat protein
MNPRSIAPVPPFRVLIFSVLTSIAMAALAIPSALAQLAPLGGAATTPPPPAQTPSGAPLPTLPPAPASLSIEAMNADLKTARAANQEKRFADAETLMRKDTAARPKQPYLWIELGVAQLGQKKYDEAETSFKAALNGGEAVQKQTDVAGFYQEGKGTTGHVAISSAPVTSETKTLPEVNGLANSNLGEVYIRTNRIPEAQAAFDKAAAANPAQAGLFYGNAAVFLFQAGNAPAQLDAATKAIAADPARARNYYFKAQALTTQATVDPKTSKLILPPGCLDAYQKYLELDPNGQFAPDTKAILTAAGATPKPPGKK